MIKVRVGQVWHCNGFNKDVEMMYYHGNGLIEWSDGFTSTADWAHSNMRFIPQNDLEWLAVKLDEWKSIFDGMRAFKKVDIVSYTSHDEGHDCMKGSTPYTKQQWQNMRYHLGLDTKPHYKMINGEWVK